MPAETAGRGPAPEAEPGTGAAAPPALAPGSRAPAAPARAERERAGPAVLARPPRSARTRSSRNARIPLRPGPRTSCPGSGSARTRVRLPRLAAVTETVAEAAEAPEREPAARKRSGRGAPPARSGTTRDWTTPD